MALKFSINSSPKLCIFATTSYLPPERWQHNLEHGSVVLLYHPCLDNTQLTQVCLKSALGLSRHTAVSAAQ